MPSEQEVAYLIVIVSYLDQLDPAEVGDLNNKTIKSLSERRARAKQAKASDRDYLESQVYFPNGNPLHYDSHNKNVVLDMAAVPGLWQLTAAFRKDFNFAVQVLVPSYLREFSTPSLIQLVIRAEKELFAWSDALVHEAGVLEKEILPSQEFRSLITEQGTRHNICYPPLEYAARIQVTEDFGEDEEVVAMDVDQGVSASMPSSDGEQAVKDRRRKRQRGKRGGGKDAKRRKKDP